MIASVPNSFLQLIISHHICLAFSISNFLALKNLSIMWWSSCLEGRSSSKMRAWRKASTAWSSSTSISSTIETDITLLFLRVFLVKECLNLFEALIAFFLNEQSFVFLSSSEHSWSTLRKSESLLKDVSFINFKKKKKKMSPSLHKIFTIFFPYLAYYVDPYEQTLYPPCF